VVDCEHEFIGGTGADEAGAHLASASGIDIFSPLHSAIPGNNLRNFMKHVLCLLLAFFSYQYCRAGEPAFYVVDIKQHNEVLLHYAGEQADPKEPLPFVLLDTGKSACCFVFGSPKSKHAKVDDGIPEHVLSSGHGEGREPFEFWGRYKADDRSRAQGKLDLQIAFGLVGMDSVKLVGKDKFAVAMLGSPSTVYVHQCLDGEGIRFELFHSIKEKKPYANYYLWLGYDVEPDCWKKPNGRK
jgi:hypothetical protein